MIRKTEQLNVPFWQVTYLTPFCQFPISKWAVVQSSLKEGQIELRGTCPYVGLEGGGQGSLGLGWSRVIPTLAKNRGWTDLISVRTHRQSSRKWKLNNHPHFSSSLQTQLPRSPEQQCLWQATPQTVTTKPSTLLSVSYKVESTDFLWS